MFEKGLPFGGPRADNGIRNIPTVNRSVLLSLLWLFGSFAFIYMGYRHCSYYSRRNSFVCDDHECVFTMRVSGNNSTTLNIPRQDVRRVDTVRIRKNGQVDTTAKSRSRLGHTVQLNYNYPTEPGSRIKVEKTILLSDFDLGRRTGRDSAAKITNYLDRSKDSVSLSFGSSTTVIGILMIIAGILSVALSLLLGQWSDPEPRRLKKAS